MKQPTLKEIKTATKIVSFFHEDDFIPESDFNDFGIDKINVPKGFKVWRHSSPPLKNYLNIYGGNVYGISFMEMVTQGVDEDTLGLLDSEDECKTNAFYQEKGIYIVRSRTGREYYLVPENIEAGLRKDITDGIDQISNALEDYLKEAPERERSYRVGTFTDTDDLIFNVLQFRFPDLEFVKIDPEQEFSRQAFDFIYITSSILNEGIRQLQEKNKEPAEGQLKRFVSSIICLAFKLLDDDGVFFILHNQWIYHPKAKVRIRFRKNEEEKLKKILIFCHLFGCSYHLHSQNIDLSRHSFANYLRCPFTHLDQGKKLLPFKKEIKDISVEEISSLQSDDLPFSRRVFHFGHLPVLNRLFRAVHLQVLLPDYLKETLQEQFRLKESDFFTTWISVYKKQEAVSLATIEAPLVEQHLSGAPLELTAEYKNTFRYVIEVLNIIKDILQFELHRTEGDMSAINLFPFSLQEDNRPIGQIMKLQSLFSGDNPYFSQTTILVTKIDLLEELKRIISPRQESLPILENFDILSLMGFSIEELQEIFLIVTDHGPITRIIFGKYPLRSMEVLTNKIHQEGYSYYQMKNLLECFLFHSVAEALAANGRQLNQAQWERFFEVLEEAEEVVFNLKGSIDWEILQKEEIDRADGTLNMVAQILLRIYKMEFRAQIITNLYSRTDEELFIDAGYEVENFKRLKEIKGVIQLMERFKSLNYPQNDFSKPYFFRNFLDCEFHGTGRTIAKLGLVRGFKLLWMAVISAESHKINFNTLSTGDVLITKIKQNLDRLSEHDLTLEYLEEVKKELHEKGVCYIYDSGFQLKIIPKTRTLEVHYEDIDENINKMLKLLTKINGKRMSEIGIEVFREIESLFLTIENYPEVYDQEIRRLKNGSPKPYGEEATGEKIAYLEKKNQDISTIRDKIKQFFFRGIFYPTEIYTNLQLLFDHCPRILNLTVREIEEYRHIKIKRKEHIEPAANYILRCLKKFQAIASGNMDDYQNLEAFVNLCRKEFGDITRQTIGMHHSQLNLLKKLYQNLSADYQEALMIALVFQDVGKIPQNIIKYRNSIDFSNHGHAGVKVLEREKTLEKLEIQEGVVEKALFLIYHHGLIGQIVKGEDPYEVIKPITDSLDSKMLDAFFIHSIIAAAAFKEDLMTYDLFEKFLGVFRLAIQVLKEEVTWEDIRRGRERKLSWEVQAVQESIVAAYASGGGKKKPPSPPALPSRKWTPGEEAMAMQRLFNLLGAGDIRYAEVLRADANSELNWKYFYKRERLFRSLGFRTFESQFIRAQRITAGFKELPCQLQEIIVFYLSGKYGLIHFFALNRTAEQVSWENLMKFTLWILAAVEYRKNLDQSPEERVSLNFFRLSNIVDDRKNLINKELEKMSLQDFDSKSWRESFMNPKRGLRIRIKPRFGIIHFFFIDPVDISQDIREMKRIVNYKELDRFYRRRLLFLSNDPSVFKDQISLFSRHYRRCLIRVKLLAVKRMQDRMEEIAVEILQGRREFTHLKKIYEQAMAAKFCEDQHLRLLRDKYEYTMGRLRDDMVQNMIRNIYTSKSVSELEKHYIEIIHFMKSHRPFFQKEVQKHLLNQYLRRKSFFIASDI